MNKVEGKALQRAQHPGPCEEWIDEPVICSDITWFTFSFSAAHCCSWTHCMHLYLCHPKSRMMSCVGPGASDFLLSFGFLFSWKRPDWIRCCLETFQHLLDGFWVDCTLCWPWKPLGHDDDGVCPVPPRPVLSLSVRNLGAATPRDSPVALQDTLWVPSVCHERPRGPRGLEFCLLT